MCKSDSVYILVHTFMKMSWAQLSVSESQKHRHAILQVIYTGEQTVSQNTTCRFCDIQYGQLQIRARISKWLNINWTLL